MSVLKRTPLYPVYAKYGGKTIDFGGWELPVQFAGILEEHETVRNKVGLFDVSHMGEVEVRGENALHFLQQLATNDVSKLETGKAQYTLMCYPDGGVVDDLLIYKKGENDYMLVINASNIDKDIDWLEKHREDGVLIRNMSDETALVALQGPCAGQVLQTVCDQRVEDLLPFHFRDEQIVSGISVLLSRTGYTGEDGFELYVRSEQAVDLWEALLEAGSACGIKPIGLGARDTLRFEARLPLYGQELSKSISPLEAGLGFFVKLKKDEFIGKEALAEQKEQGIPRKLVGIEMIDRGIPRTHYPVLSMDGEGIGEVTSGTFAPTLKKNVGLALVATGHAAPGTNILVEIRGKKLQAVVVQTPFYKKESK